MTCPRSAECAWRRLRSFTQKRENTSRGAKLLAHGTTRSKQRTKNCCRNADRLKLSSGSKRSWGDPPLALMLLVQTVKPIARRASHTRLCQKAQQSRPVRHNTEYVSSILHARSYSAIRSLPQFNYLPLLDRCAGGSKSGTCALLRIAFVFPWSFLLRQNSNSRQQQEQQPGRNLMQPGKKRM